MERKSLIRVNHIHSLQKCVTMSLSPARCKILETMLLNEKPAKAQDIANQVGSEFKPVNMHVIGLAKVGYAVSPAKGQYVITSKGKAALGIPETTKECAQQLLAQTPQDRAFHFYTAMHKPLNMYANWTQRIRRETGNRRLSLAGIPCLQGRLREMVHKPRRLGTRQENGASTSERTHRGDAKSQAKRDYGQPLQGA